MEPNKIAISLTVSEWNVVMNALGGRPFAEVASVISAIQTQAREAEATVITEPTE